MNLDVETNLKLKQSLEATSSLQDDASFQHFKAVIKSEDPNVNLYTFVGAKEYEGRQHGLSSQQLLLKDSKLRNTNFIYGVVIFTDHDTKVMQNATNPPSKRSKMERRLDKLIYVLLFALVVMSTIGSIFFGIRTGKDIHIGMLKRWYLRPDYNTAFIYRGSAVIQILLPLLAICHTAIPDIDESANEITYDADFPDEDAFVIAARELGFEFYQRTQTSISFLELGSSTGKSVDKSYNLMNILEFNSTRKRMSVIVKCQDG